MASAFFGIGFYGIVITTLLGLFAYWWFFLRHFDKKVFIYDKTSNGQGIIETKARYVIKNKVAYWQLLKPRELVPVPPSKALGITGKGMKIGHLWRVGPQDFKWVNFSEMQFDGEALIPVALTTGQKQAAVNQFALAVEESATPGNKLLEKALPIIVIAILLLFGYLFMDMYTTKAQKINDNTAAVAGQFAAASANLAKAMEDYKGLVENRQTLNANTGNGRPAEAPN